MQFTTSLVLAQGILPGTTYLDWVLSSQGTFSSLLVLLSAGLLFLGACYLVKTRRPASVLAAYLVLLPLPCIISICGWISGTIASLVVIAESPDLIVTRGAFAGGIAASLMGLLVAIVASSPTYFVLAYGLLARTLRPPTNSAEMIAPRVAPPDVSREPILGKITPAIG